MTKKVTNVPDSVMSNRHNKLAKGMTRTLYRSQMHKVNCMKDAVISLTVRGTTDTLRGMFYLRQRKVCPCCGGKTGKWELNTAGRNRLRLARYRAEMKKERERISYELIAEIENDGLSSII